MGNEWKAFTLQNQPRRTVFCSLLIGEKSKTSREFCPIEVYDYMYGLRRRPPPWRPRRPDSGAARSLNGYRVDSSRQLANTKKSILPVTRQCTNTREYSPYCRGENLIHTLSPPPQCNTDSSARRRLLNNKKSHAMYTLRRPVMGEVLSTRIWGVPPACLGSR